MPWSSEARRGPGFQASLAFSQAGFATIERQEGVRFEVDRFHFDESTRPADFSRQARRAAEAGVSGVLFMPSRYKDEAARQDEAVPPIVPARLGSPLSFFERNLRGRTRPLEYDLVAADDFDGGLRCTQHLLDQGRRRIAFITGSPTSSHEGRLAGYLASLHQRRPAGVLLSWSSHRASPTRIPTRNWPTTSGPRPPTVLSATRITPRSG